MPLTDTLPAFVPSTPGLGAPIFIGGVERSGTTLLRVMLDSHPQICCGPETQFLPLVSEIYRVAANGLLPNFAAYGVEATDLRLRFRQLVEGLFEGFRKASGKPRWAEKTPRNVRYMVGIGEIFPDARFIHMVRDGRDVACSLVRMNWTDFEAQQRMPFTQSIAAAAKYWRDSVLTGLRDAKHPSITGRVLVVPYESLVLRPESTMRSVLEFVGESWNPAVLNYYARNRDHEPAESSKAQVSRPLYHSSLGRWRRDMSADDRATFEAEAGVLLRDLGYSTGSDWQFEAQLSPNESESPGNETGIVSS